MQSAANENESQSELTWTALNNIAQTYGMPAIDFDRFAARFSNEPIMQELVDRYDNNGIVLKTQQMAMPDQPREKDPEHSTVKAMANRAFQHSKHDKF